MRGNTQPKIFNFPLKKTLLTLVCVGFLFFWFTAKAEAADFYINADCATNGDGSSWSCSGTPNGAGAFNNPPADASCVFNGYIWQKGSTYWIAGSDTVYTSICFRRTNGSGNIIFKKASPDNHGTDTGWTPSYGSKQAVMGPIKLWTNNIIIDGSYRATPESGYGIKVQATGSSNLIENPNNIPSSNNTFKYLELTHTSFNSSTAYGFGLYGNGGNLIQYVYAHDLSGLCFKGNMDVKYNTSGGLNNTTIEESVCGGIGKSTGTGHTELLKDDASSSGTIIRNNLFYDWGAPYSTGGLVLSSGQTNWNIYNNIFIQRGTGTLCGNGAITGLTVGHSYTGIKIYNNTFANISGQCSNIFAGGLGDFSGTGNEVKNNLFYNIPTLTNICGGGCTKLKNWFYLTPNYTLTGDDILGNGNPFVNSPSENFHLVLGASPINAGLNLLSVFTTDKDGIVRPTGAWDIGAYQFANGEEPPPPLGVPVPGDLNLDHTVNVMDFSLLNSKWNQNYSAYDLNNDGFINSLDFAIMKNNWGKTW